MQRKVLGVGLIGAGFIGQFHVRSWTRVRDADIVAIGSRTLASAQALAEEAETLGVGTGVTAYDDVASLVRDERVEAVWVLTPNDTRVEVVRAICDEVRAGRSSLRAIAIEKPLARTLGEAKQVLAMIEEAGLLHGYLENQLYAPSITRAHDLLWKRGAAAAGNPYLARCAEEHSGPHKAWFWDGVKQGGGVLNDMMCHSVEAGRYLLTPPGVDPSTWLTPVSVSASIQSLKWSRPRYAEELLSAYPGAPDYRSRPSEDYARANFEFVNGDGETVIAEGTTSWSFVGAGLRLSFELLGPEYSMSADTLDTEAKVFFSRALTQSEGEDLVEKQNAEQGLMPLVSDEALAYGYTDENTRLATCFLRGEQPVETLANGVAVVELLMAAYLSAQTGRTVTFPVDLDDFVPDVARGTWKP
ncbi:MULTISPECIES: Gfo/Idh/MocA family protein [Arsenicicoccus]|uniref:Gfo/Idh/MocA family protein n=1 Tax=Arsenicicoccus TaxID=267408 RepID=UPI0002E5869D|nr:MULTISPECIES: Gfo/Idh/MocA family oxidoreductase [Arsenicicoccus]AKT50789.1 dehydrogenase [Arsenicicoccus sp. oral taxon 190]